MRHTQPLTADEERIDAALRKQHRTHAQQDEALTRYRLAVVLDRDPTANLGRVADLILGECSL
jgi:hypothetical protein